ncbi:hypothetical protein BH09BAC1_BH09BAC1_11070 [soil metagenome]
MIFSLFGLSICNAIWFAVNTKQNHRILEQPSNTTGEIYEKPPIVEDTTPYPNRAPSAGYKMLVLVDRDVTIKEYYAFIDSMATAHIPPADSALKEYILVQNNPWIIDTLVSLDYYERKRRGEHIQDQKEMVAIHKGSILLIPSQSTTDSIKDMLAHTVIDVNIPEFKLRILVNGVAKYTFPVRVGQNKRKYLAMAGREVSLKTPIGEGEIIRIVRDPLFINPADNHRYYTTGRDDKVRTELPLIPWLEPTIDGRRQGSLIHPTTNEATLGKSYSNACVGTPEGAAWITYYYAPLGTKVRFRYDLKVVNEVGDTIILEDVYHLQKDNLPLSMVR